MTLIRQQNQIPNIFNRFFDTNMDWTNRTNADIETTLPAINIKENKDSFEVELAAPGFNKEDFNIELDKDVLTIWSEKKAEEESESNRVKEGERFTKREFSYQAFKRTFTLPKLVEGDQINARYESGILSVVIPKKEEAKPKPAKQIAVA